MREEGYIVKSNLNCRISLPDLKCQISRPDLKSELPDLNCQMSLPDLMATVQIEQGGPTGKKSRSHSPMLFEQRDTILSEIS